MSIKETLMLGAVGAAGIYLARQIPALEQPLDGTPTNNKGSVPLVPEFMVRNNWSLMFTLIPAAAAYYLSN